MIFYNNAHLLT